MSAWITAWGSAVSIADRRPAMYAKDLTLRYPLLMTLSGSAVRITLDNFCGTEAVTLAYATVAHAIGGASTAPELHTLLFDGVPTVTLPAGESRTSDPLPFAIAAGETLTVSLYFADITQLRSGVVIQAPCHQGFFAVGNYANQQEMSAAYTKPTPWFYFLSGVDVLTDTDAKAVICYGDSITAQGWPDYLMKRVLHAGYPTAIVRKAASGTRILRQYEDITYESYGLKGLIRFPHEIPSVSGADTIIIQQGINDIIHPVGVDVNPFRPWSDLPTVDELIAGLRAYIHAAKAWQLRVYLGTLLPIAGWRTDAPFREEMRCALNDWIRTTPEADGCIDFDFALRDPNKPAAFAEGFDSGDHLHPSQAAYRRMAEVVPEELLY